MRHSYLIVPLLMILGPSVRAAKVEAFFMTTSSPGSGTCAQMRGSLPPSTSVSVSAPRVYFFYMLSDLHKGDTVSTRFFRPDGTVYAGAGARQTAYARDSALGCWWDEVGVAGTDLGATPGLWNAAVLLNGTKLVSQPFTVEGAARPAAPASPSSVRVSAPEPPVRTPLTNCREMLLMYPQHAPTRIPLDQITVIDWQAGPGDMSPAHQGKPEARPPVAAMLIHLASGKVEKVDLVHPPEIRFVCDVEGR